MEDKEKLWTRDFVLVIIINFLVFLNHLMILSTFPFFIERLGYSDTVSGACATAFSLVAVLARPFVGWLLDTGRRRVLLGVGLIGMALMPMGYLLIYTALASLALAILLRMVHGLSLACANTSTSTMATDILPRSRFSEGMGMFGMATALATACAPAIGEALMKRGFGALFGVAAGCMVLSLVLLFCLRIKPLPRVKKPLRPGDLVEPSALPASVVVLIFLLTYGALENYILKFAAAQPGITVSGGLFFTVMAVLLFLSRVTIGKLADKRGEALFVYSCNGLMLAALLLLALVPGNVTFLIAAALSGYAFGGIEPALQSMAVHTAPPQRRGAANSTFLCAYDIGIGLGGGLAGLLIDRVGYGSMFGVIAVANVLSVAVYVLWGRRHASSMTRAICAGEKK